MINKNFNFYPEINQLFVEMKKNDLNIAGVFYSPSSPQ